MSAGLDPLALTRAAMEVADGRPLLEVAVELAGAAGRLEQLLARLAQCTRFAATLEAVDLEPSSTRALVTVHARPDDEAEVLRTDRTDAGDGWGRIMAERARRLIGRRVLVNKLLEDAGADRRVRVVVWLDDLEGDDAGGHHAGAPRAGARPTTPADVPATGPQAEPAPDEPGPVAQVRAVCEDAGVEPAAVDALMRARYGAGCLEELEEEHARHLLVRLADPESRARFAAAAASDLAAEREHEGAP